MDDKKKKKIFSIVFLSIVVIMLVINLTIFSKKDDDKKQNEVPQEEVVEEEKIEKEDEFKDPLAETKKATEYLYRLNITPLGDGEEYPEDDAQFVKQRFISYAAKGDYQQIINEGNQITNKYKLSEGENLDIAGMIHDANLFKQAHEHEDRFKFGNIVKESKTPYLLIANTMWSDNFSRRPIIEDQTGLAPIGYSSFEFKERRMFRNVQEAQEEQTFNYRNIPEEIFTFHNDANTVYAQDILLPNEGGLPITAYVWEDLNGYIYFYGMYAPDDAKHYEHSLEWWMEKDHIYEAAEKQQEKNYEIQGEKGIITNEQLDKLFESGW